MSLSSGTTMRRQGDEGGEDTTTVASVGLGGGATGVTSWQGRTGAVEFQSEDVDGTLAVDTSADPNQLGVADSGIDTTQLASEAVTEAKIDASDDPSSGEVLTYDDGLEWAPAGVQGGDGIDVDPSTTPDTVSVDSTVARTHVDETFDQDVTVKGNAFSDRFESETYTPGWSSGEGVTARTAGPDGRPDFAEFGHLSVRGTARFREFEIRQLTFSKGPFGVTPGGGKLSSVDSSSHSIDQTGIYDAADMVAQEWTFENDSGSATQHGLEVGDRLLAQRFDPTQQDVIGQVRAIVESVVDPYTVKVNVEDTIYGAPSPGADTEGWEFMMPASSNTGRDSLLYLDPYTPGLDIFDGMSDFGDWDNRTATTRLGDISSFTGANADGHGIYTEQFRATDDLIVGSLDKSGQYLAYDGSTLDIVTETFSLSANNLSIESEGPITGEARIAMTSGTTSYDPLIIDRAETSFSTLDTAFSETRGDLSGTDPTRDTIFESVDYSGAGSFDTGGNLRYKGSFSISGSTATENTNYQVTVTIIVANEENGRIRDVLGRQELSFSVSTDSNQEFSTSETFDVNLSRVGTATVRYSHSVSGEVGAFSDYTLDITSREVYQYHSQTVVNESGVHVKHTPVYTAAVGGSGGISVGSGGSAVSSVFGRTGGITAQSGDYTHSQISGISSDDHHTRPSAGDGLTDNSDTFDVVVSAFAGHGLEGDGSDDLRFASSAFGDGLSGGSGSDVSVVVGDFAGHGLEASGSDLRLDAGAVGDGLNGGDGTDLSVDSTVARTHVNETFEQDVTIQGKLHTVGDEVVHDVETVEHQDNLLLLNAGETGNGVSNGVVGFEADRGTEPPVKMIFDEADDLGRIGVEYRAINYSNLSGSFELHEEVVGQSSGAKALVWYDSSGTLRTKGRTSTFTSGETIVGQTSGASATIDSISVYDQTQRLAALEDSPQDTALAFWDTNDDRFETSNDLVWDGTDLNIGTGHAAVTDRDETVSGAWTITGDHSGGDSYTDSSAGSSLLIGPKDGTAYNGSELFLNYYGYWASLSIQATNRDDWPEHAGPTIFTTDGANPVPFNDYGTLVLAARQGGGNNTGILLAGGYTDSSGNRTRRKRLWIDGSSTKFYEPSGNEIARFDSAGNFGLGTTSPSRKLDVRGSGDVWATVRSKGTGNYAGYLMGNSDNWQASIRWEDDNSQLTIGTSSGSQKTIRINVSDQVGINTDPSYPLDVDGEIYTTTGLTADGDLMPDTAYSHSVGSQVDKWLTVNAAELRVSTLVSEEEVATVGGRQLVGTSTELVKHISSSGTGGFAFKHNNLQTSDRIRMEARGNVEFLRVDTMGSVSTDTSNNKITYNSDLQARVDGLSSGDKFKDTALGTLTVSSVSYDSSNNDTTITVQEDITFSAVAFLYKEGSDGYHYVQVIRDLDGTGANSWEKGDGVFNSGQTGEGWIDLYAQHAFSDTSQATITGPTIAFRERTGSAYDAIAERAVIGNLHDTYDYTSDVYGLAAGDSSGTWVAVDAANGFRVMDGATKKIGLDTNGDAYFAGEVSATTGDIGAWDIGTSTLTGGNVVLDSSGQVKHSGGDWLLDNDGSGHLADGSISWTSGGATTIEASLTITGGSGVSNLSDAGSLAEQDNADWSSDVTGTDKPADNATVGADWTSNLSGVPSRFGDSPGAEGLYVTSSNLGYYDGSAWGVYMQSDGQFFLDGSGDDSLTWDGSALDIVGTITATDGQIASLDIQSDAIVQDSLVYIGNNLSNYNSTGRIFVGNWNDGADPVVRVNGGSGSHVKMAADTGSSDTFFEVQQGGDAILSVQNDGAALASWTVNSTQFIAGANSELTNSNSDWHIDSEGFTVEAGTESLSAVPRQYTMLNENGNTAGRIWGGNFGMFIEQPMTGGDLLIESAGDTWITADGFARLAWPKGGSAKKVEVDSDGIVLQTINDSDAFISLTAPTISFAGTLHGSGNQIDVADATTFQGDVTIQGDLLGSGADEFLSWGNSSTLSGDRNWLFQLDPADSRTGRTFDFERGGTTVMRIYDSGDVGALGSFADNTLSDLRAKDDVTQIDNALDIIRDIRGFGYTWKDDLVGPFSGDDYGVAAQDVQSRIPEIVNERGDGYLGIKIDRLHAFEIEAIKENDRRIRDLEKENERLRERLNS